MNSFICEDKLARKTCIEIKIDGRWCEKIRWIEKMPAKS